jgi:hypothetical protein
MINPLTNQILGSGKTSIIRSENRQQPALNRRYLSTLTTTSPPCFLPFHRSLSAGQVLISEGVYFLFLLETRQTEKELVCCFVQ